MVADIHADGVYQFGCGCDGKGSFEGYQTDLRRESVDIVKVLIVSEKDLVEQGNGNDAVELEAFKLFGAGNTCGDHSYGDGGDKVKEHGEPKGEEHHQQVISLDVEDSGDESPIYGVPSDLYQDACKDSNGNRCDIFAKAHHDRQQYCDAQHA